MPDDRLDQRNQKVGQRRKDRIDRKYFMIDYEERRIWGATAGMLMNFYRRLNGLKGPMRPE